LSIDRLKKLDELYGLTKIRNAEIRFRWYVLAIQHEHKEIFPHTVSFLTEQGRMKFVRPLYRHLFKSATGKQLALETFEKHQHFYHPICSKMVSRDFTL